jgi:hypothetical protein
MMDLQIAVRGILILKGNDLQGKIENFPSTVSRFQKPSFSTSERYSYSVYNTRCRWSFVAAFVAFCMLFGTVVFAAEVTLAWDPNIEPDLSGYTVYYAVGAPGPPYDYAGDLPLDQLPDPDNPQVTLTDLDQYESYYFALTAYDSEGNESSFSTSLCIYIDDVIQECEPDPVISGSGGGSGGSSSGGGCFIGTAGSGTLLSEGATGSLIPWHLILVIAVLSAVKFAQSRKPSNDCPVFLRRHVDGSTRKRPLEGDWS